MRIAVSADDRLPIVDRVLEQLKKRGHEVVFFGPAAFGESVDWPLCSRDAAEMVARGEADEAIVMCWTGTGASIAANKVSGVRAALCVDAESARGARKWNHANALALSMRLLSDGLAQEILDAWFSTPFSEDHWNKKQVARIVSQDQQRRNA